MKRFIKSVLALVCVTVFAVSVQAQQYATTTHTLTDAVAAVTTNAALNKAAFTATKNGEVAVWVSSKLTAAGTTTSDYVFQTSTDGTTYAGPSFTLTIANAGTTTVNVSSNVTLGAHGYIRLKSVTNGDDDGVLTNIVVRYTVKPNRQDGK